MKICLNVVIKLYKNKHHMITDTEIERGNKHVIEI